LPQLEISKHQLFLQRFLLEQKNKGFLLCVSSKNELNDVLTVFREHNDMLLRELDITAWAVNWEAKSKNIAGIALDLNLSLDSFIFIDDSPIECLEVSENCPDVLVLKIPERADFIEPYFKSIWAFDKPRITATDKLRHRLYAQEKNRSLFRKDSATLKDYISGLNLRLKLLPLLSDDVERAYELMKRVNQFSNGQSDMTREDIIHCLQAGYSGYILSVSDRFGDYGQSGCLLYHNDDGIAVVDRFYLSCRMLGRGVEYKAMAMLSDLFEQRGCHRVRVVFSRTTKNDPFMIFLQTISDIARHPFDGYSDLEFEVNALQHIDYCKYIKNTLPSLSAYPPDHPIIQFWSFLTVC
jgi:FkbH-like protein